MRIVSLLPIVALLGATACSCFNSSDPVVVGSKFFQDPAKTTSLGGNIAMVSGVGGNVLAITGHDGTTLLDTGVTPRVGDLDAVLKGLNAEPVATVVDTHFHFDHTGGNAHYGKQGATIIAQENVKTRLSTPQYNFLLDMTFPPAPKEALPTQTFTTGTTLQAGGHKLNIIHPVKSAHTDGDAFVWIPDANVLFTGDLFFNGFYPLIDYNAGGSIDGMVASADAMLAKADSKTKIIAGHGPIASKPDLKRYRDMLATVSMRIHKLMAQGKTEAEIIAAKPTADFDAKWAGGFFTGDAFTRLSYRSLKH
jgi:glyoxylase-like metal-dependent hydrolase (beta-lactamase superfamily II)